MDSLYIKKDESRNGIRTFDPSHLNYTYSWFDVNSAIRSPKSRNEFLNKETVNVYPDTTVWVKDFNYSYNDPMHQDYFPSCLSRLSCCWSQLVSSPSFLQLENKK